MTEARELSASDLYRGWYPLACGCHGHVIASSLLPLIPANAIECCNGLPGVVRIEVLEKIGKEENKS
jgi:hypothetical protein